jgi:serine protease Do
MIKKNLALTVVSLAIILTIILSMLTGCVDVTGSATTVPSTTPSPINPSWTPPVTGSQIDELPGIADVVALVKPAVVSINTEILSQSIFGSFTQEGAGSGWIIDENGIIVTNNHVIEGANAITVTLDDGRTFSVDPASVHTDVLNDLAIFSIEASNLPTLSIGNSSQLRVGDWVIAIGNALGLGIRATEGIVSRQGVTIPFDQNQTLYDLLETTAVINPGNSGGPLVNLSGEVIGITSAKITQTGVEGMGYAISIDTAMPIIEQLVSNGYIIRPWLGVTLVALSPSVIAAVEMDSSLDWVIKVEEGILLTGVLDGSPAGNAGLKPGDVIVTVGGEKVTDNQGFMKILHQSVIGKPLEITYFRGDAEYTTTVVPIESPPPE